MTLGIERFSLRLERLARYLVPASILYLGLPYVIFFFGWMQWYWALLGSGLLLVALVESTWLAFRQELPQETSSDDAQNASLPLPSFDLRFFNLRHALFLLLICLAWLSFSGAGGVGYQRGDWIKHESVLKDLIEHSWPVVYDFYAHPVPLVYYLAYYLPAAVIGKIGGWAAAQAALFVWTLLGLYISFLWFWVLVGKALHSASTKLFYWCALLFIFFSGLDIIGKIIARWVEWSDGPWDRIERWGPWLEYSANMVLLFWVPNQALVGWIAIGLILYAILTIRRRSITWLPLGLSAFWSPLVMLGLIPYLITEFLSDSGPLHRRLLRYVSWSNLCGLALLGFVGVYYLSKTYEVAPAMHASIPGSFFISTHEGSTLGAWGLLGTFLAVEVGIFAILARKSIGSEGRLWRWLSITTLVLLTILPFYKLGMFNDLVMRASIPALFCLAVLVGRSLFQSGLGLATRVALIVALLVGAATSVMELKFNVTETIRIVRGIPDPGAVTARGIVEVYDSVPESFVQYVGGYESLFFEYLALKQDWADAPGQRRYLSFGDHKVLFEGYALEGDDLANEALLQPGEQVTVTSKVYVFLEPSDFKDADSPDNTEENSNGNSENDDPFKKRPKYEIALRLVAEEGGREVWKGQGWLQDRVPSAWRWIPSIRWFDARPLTIPTDAAAGLYRLEFSVIDVDTHELLPATALPSGKYLGEMVPVGYLTVGETENAPEQLLPAPSQLGGKVALLGTTPALPFTLQAGAALNINLFWQAVAAMDSDYTVFVQLLDSGGKLIAQQDHQPRNGFLPTSIWREGRVISDGYTLVVPQDTPPGSYSLVAGMYELESGVRLPVTHDGKSAGDVIMLGQIEVR